MNIQVRRLKDGKIFTSDNYKDEIKSIEFEEYLLRVKVVVNVEGWYGEYKTIICQKQDIDLDDYELRFNEEFGEIL